MDSVGMHIDFRVKFNKVNSNKNKGFLTQEIDLFLNDQMDKFVSAHATPKSNTRQEGFEETQTRLDDIRTVIREATTDTDHLDGRTQLTLDTFNRGKKIDFPNDYRMLVEDSTDTYDECSNYYSRPNRLFGSNKVNWALTDSFHKSHVKSPVSEVVNNTLRVYEDDFTISNIHISYVYKYPAIEYNSQDCVLPVHTHRQIVDMAVEKVNAVINTGNYEKYLNEISKNE